MAVSTPPPGFTPYAPSMPRPINARTTFSYSLDGVTCTSPGAPFVSQPGRWVGARIGVFAQALAGMPANTATRIGWSDIDEFRGAPLAVEPPR